MTGSRIFAGLRRLIARWRGSDLAEAFRQAFEELAALQRAHPAAGAVVAAVRRGRVVGSTFLPLGDEPEFAIVGRHERCDLHLPDDAEVAARQLAIGALRGPGGDLRLHAVDLAGSGFLSEARRVCERTVIEGALFVRAGDHHLFALPTGPACDIPWGETAGETWATFPARIPLVERPLVRAAAGRRPAPGPPVAMLRIDGDRRRAGLAISDAALERGLIIGRRNGTVPIDAGGVSSVHLLILRAAGRLWAVDTASTNGTWQHRRPIRQTILGDADTLLLGDDVSLSWWSAAVRPSWKALGWVRGAS